MVQDGKRNYLIILIVYICATVPTYFTLNKFMVVYVPLLTLTLTMYLLRNEYVNLSIKEVFSKNSLGKWIQIGILIPLTLEIAFNLFITSTQISVPHQLMLQYPIMSVHMLLNAPIVEEVVFRKIIFGQLSKRTNFYIGSSVSSLLFGMLHNDWQGFMLYFMIGVIFCHIYKKTNSIIPSLLGHFVLNLIFILNISSRM